MRLLFLGKQGCGKGTQAKIVAEKLGICHISTGDILRNTNGSLKKEVDNYMNKGSLIPDKLMLKIIKKRIYEQDCKKGFILDGFPRNLKQAKALDKITRIDHAVDIDIPDTESMRRLSGRLNCRKCGALFNLATNPPKIMGKCDVCGSILYQRADDKPKAIKKRLEVYYKETAPIINHYKAIKVNGTREINKVANKILEIIKC